MCAPSVERGRVEGRVGGGRPNHGRWRRAERFQRYTSCARSRRGHRPSCSAGPRLGWAPAPLTAGLDRPGAVPDDLATPGTTNSVGPSTAPTPPATSGGLGGEKTATAADVGGAHGPPPAARAAAQDRACLRPGGRPIGRCRLGAAWLPQRPAPGGLLPRTGPVGGGPAPRATPGRRARTVRCPGQCLVSPHGSAECPSAQWRWPPRLRTRRPSCAGGKRRMFVHTSGPCLAQGRSAWTSPGQSPPARPRDPGARDRSFAGTSVNAPAYKWRVEVRSPVAAAPRPHMYAGGCGARGCPSAAPHRAELAVGLGHALDLVLLLDGVRVAAALGRVGDLVGEALRLRGAARQPSGQGTSPPAPRAGHAQSS